MVDSSNFKVNNFPVNYPWNNDIALLPSHYNTGLVAEGALEHEKKEVHSVQCLTSKNIYTCDFYVVTIRIVWLMKQKALKQKLVTWL